VNLYVCLVCRAIPLRPKVLPVLRCCFALRMNRRYVWLTRVGCLQLLVDELVGLGGPDEGR
jgi:hypothetical protein